MYHWWQSCPPALAHIHHWRGAQISSKVAWTKPVGFCVLGTWVKPFGLPRYIDATCSIDGDVTLLQMHTSITCVTWSTIAGWDFEPHALIINGEAIGTASWSSRPCLYAHIHQSRMTVSCIQNSHGALIQNLFSNSILKKADGSDIQKRSGKPLQLPIDSLGRLWWCCNSLGLA